MASSDINHAQTIGKSTISTESQDSTGSDKPYTCFECVKVRNQLSNSIDSSVKSTDSQCCSQCQEESRNNCLAASHHSGPYENPVLPKTHEEIKASNRTFVQTSTQNEGRGLSKAGYADSGSYQTIPGDSLNSTKREIGGNNREKKGHDNHGCADSGSSEDTLHSEESRNNSLAASHHSGPYENPVLPKTEASNRTIVHTNTQNEGRRLNKAGYADSGSFQTIPGDSLNSTKNELEDNNREEKGHDNHGWADSGSSEDSLHSIFTDTDITSKEFIMRLDIHVLKDEHDIPIFTTPIGEQQYQPRKTECRRDSEPWTQITCSLSGVDTETDVGPPSGMNIENASYIADNRLFTEIDSTREDSHYLGMENHHKNHHKSKKNCPLRIMILIILIGCISGGVAWVVYNKYVLGSKDTPTVITVDLPDFPDKCENDIASARVGEQMCIPYTQKFTSSPSGIYVRQKSSQYLSVLQGFSVNVSSDDFEQQNGGWIINYNSSRTDHQWRFMKGKATCDSVGIYEITIEYDDGNVSSSEFEIKLKDPPLHHSVKRINDSIHVHCEMRKTCVASSLALFVNDGGSSRMIPNINVCSDNHQESGTTVSADAIIPASWLTGNMTISCVPLMTDSELAANLTSTTHIPVCEGDCVPDCKDDPQSEAYFPDKNDCTKFYQCSNGKLVFQTCSSTTYWSPSKCTCDHFDDEICNKDTNKFFKPLLTIEKCTKASLV